VHEIKEYLFGIYTFRNSQTSTYLGFHTFEAFNKIRATESAVKRTLTAEARQEREKEISVLVHLKHANIADFMV